MSSTIDPTPSSEPGSSRARLFEVMLDQLRSSRLSVVGAPPRPALTVLAVSRRAATQVRSAHDQVAEALLGLEIDVEHGGIVVVAESVVATGRSRFQVARLALGVSRDGFEACCIATDDGVVAPTEPRGWLIDACRRALGLATAPTDLHPLDLPLGLWLDRLMVQVVHHDRTPTWAQAVALCPIPTAMHTSAPAELGARITASTPEWRALRRAVASGMPAPVPVDATAARWMDDPMFARWCVGFFPDLGELRADIAFLAPPEVAAAVEQTITAARLAHDATNRPGSVGPDPGGDT